jgi:hypothetical protein
MLGNPVKYAHFGCKELKGRRNLSSKVFYKK